MISTLWNRLKAAFFLTSEETSEQEYDGPDEMPTNERLYSRENDKIGCCIRTGVVTDMFTEHGNLDGHIFFLLDNAPPAIRWGDHVEYLAFRRSEDDEWTVKRVLPTLAHRAENAVMDKADEFNIDIRDMKVYYKSSPLVRVTERAGRILTVGEEGIKVNLDNVVSLFSPLVGDALFLDVEFKGVYTEYTHTEGVDRIRANKCHRIEGVVNLVNVDGSGQIDLDVYFTHDSCAAGFMPCVGNKVSAEVIDSLHGYCSWRALNVTAFNDKSQLYRPLRSLAPVGQQDTKDAKVDIQKAPVVVGGESPFNKAMFVKNKISEFAIPERMLKIFANTEGTNENENAQIIKDLATKFPWVNQPLTVSNYRNHFHALLHIEEIKLKQNLEKLKIKCVVLSQAGPNEEYLAFDVSGVNDWQRRFIVGERIHFQYSDCPAITYEGFVHRLVGASLWLKFDKDFHQSYSQQALNVQFLLKRICSRNSHNGIDEAFSQLDEQTLMPKKLTLNDPLLELAEFPNQNLTATKQHSIVWFNKALNQEQKNAVKQVLMGVARPLPYLIYGPPGTGKTITIIEAILQILCQPKSNILVTSPSNSSADLIAERLLDSGVIELGDLVRVVSFNKYTSMTNQLKPYSTMIDLEDWKGVKARSSPVGQLPPHSNKNTLLRHRIVVGTCMVVSNLYKIGFGRHFTHVLVDEAGQATEPETMVPLGLASKTSRIILAGDPLQLGPVVTSQLAHRLGLSKSFFERLINRFPYRRDMESYPTTGGYDPRLVTLLVKNYRSLPQLLLLPNQMFYDNVLDACCTSHEREGKLLKEIHKTLPRVPAMYTSVSSVWFHGVVGRDEKAGTSWFNRHEVAVAVEYVEMLFKAGMTATDVGIITPYRQQAEKILQRIVELGLLAPKIGSVEEFQGQERTAIILSTVRSSLNSTTKVTAPEFVTNFRRLNVSITRAKALLFIIGDQHLLYRDAHWKMIMEHCIKRKSYRGTMPFGRMEVKLT